MKVLHGTVSLGLLTHVGVRVSPSPDRDSQGSAVGAALLGLDVQFVMAEVKDTRYLQPPVTSAVAWV